MSSLIDWDTFAWSGKLVVWVPDDEEYFPSGPGDDGAVFTPDDPVAPLEAGWTVVDLDGEEFDFEREGTVEVPLLGMEQSHVDLSELDYVEAFDALVDDLRGRYAFTEYKDIDFDELVEEYRPLVEEAEREEDPEAFAVAMLGFARVFGDGHVAVDIRSELYDGYMADRYGGGVGLKLEETDEGEVVVVAVAPDSPADEAGIEPGAEVLEWDGDPIDEALEDVELMRGHSSPHGLRLLQLRLLPRLPAGEEVEIEIRSPGERRSETVELEAVADPVGLEEVRGIRHPSREVLPVTFEILPSGVGYIKVSAFSDEIALSYDAWELALKRMEALEVPALVVDVRGNGGGNGTMAEQFAGAFAEEPFVLATDYSVDEEGELTEIGVTSIQPGALAWDKPVVVLIDQRCASACEIFAAGMAEAGHAIVGHTPTAGVEATVFPWTLPEGLHFRASVYLMLDNDGELFLEGVGQPPTVDVPCTAESVLSPEDEVLLAGEELVLEELEDR
jgi:C-terminal processing protease CtpA/Prc